jgi:hypothetical protein
MEAEGRDECDSASGRYSANRTASTKIRSTVQLPDRDRDHGYSPHVESARVELLAWASNNLRGQ